MLIGHSAEETLPSSWGTRLVRKAAGGSACAQSVAVLTDPVPGLLLDVALREAAAAGAAAVVLTAGRGETGAHDGPGTRAAAGSAAPDGARADRGEPRPLPATVRALADRGRVALLAADGDLAALVVAVERAAAGDAADALARVSAAAAALPAAAGDPAGAARIAARALGLPVDVREADRTRWAPRRRARTARYGSPRPCAAATRGRRCGRCWPWRRRPRRAAAAETYRCAPAAACWRRSWSHPGSGPPGSRPAAGPWACRWTATTSPCATRPAHPASATRRSNR
ncbi:hypothetical protein ACFQ1B_03105 [Streptomyces mexicanus]